VDEALETIRSQHSRHAADCRWSPTAHRSRDPASDERVDESSGLVVVERNVGCGAVVEAEKALSADRRDMFVERQIRRQDGV